jgi:hypothetical protein
MLVVRVNAWLNTLQTENGLVVRNAPVKSSFAMMAMTATVNLKLLRLPNLNVSTRSEENT